MTPFTRLTRFAMGGYTALIVVASTMTVALNAQEQSKPQQPAESAKPQAKPKDFTSTSEIIGAAVFLEASKEAKADAAREGEVVERPKAKVTECLIDCHTGEITHAVVSIGGFLGIGDKTVLVPAAQLSWNATEKRYQLGWTRAELEGRTPFDLSAATEKGLDESCDYEVAVPAKRAVAEASDAKQPAVAAEAAFAIHPSRLVKGSELSALPLYAGSDSFGKVTDLIVDRTERKVVLAVVNHGATLGTGGVDYLVAYPQLSVCTKEGNPVICARDRSVAELQGCVKYQKPERGIVDPKAAQQAMKVRKADGDGM